MRIGVQIDPGAHRDPAALLAQFTRAEEHGYHTAWVGQVFGPDTLTVLALAGTVTRRIELGASVIPALQRHPVDLAQQALTVQLASGGRLCLGVGTGHADILERKLGLDASGATARIAEWLEVLRPLLRGEYVKHSGRHLNVRANAPVPGATAPPVLLAALGPRMLEVARERADGVSVVFAGAELIEREVRPRLGPDARILASLPILVTADADAARTAAGEYVAAPTSLPAYRKTLERQGVDSVAPLALVGDEEAVTRELARLRDAGVSDFSPIVFPLAQEPEAGRRTRVLLSELARAGS